MNWLSEIKLLNDALHRVRHKKKGHFISCSVPYLIRTSYLELRTFFSDPPGIRTQDPRLKRAMLYLLS